MSVVTTSEDWLIGPAGKPAKTVEPVSFGRHLADPTRPSGTAIDEVRRPTCRHWYNHCPHWERGHSVPLASRVYTIIDAIFSGFF